LPAGPVRSPCDRGQNNSVVGKRDLASPPLHAIDVVTSGERHEHTPRIAPRAQARVSRRLDPKMEEIFR